MILNTTNSNGTNNTSTTWKGGWSIQFDNQTQIIEMNQNKSNISTETCSNTINTLSFKCSGSLVDGMNTLRSDAIKLEISKRPTPEQVKKGMNHLNLRAMIFGKINIYVLNFKIFFNLSISNFSD